MPGAPSLSSTGKVVYTLNTPYRDGTTQVAFDPVDFMARLAALVPKLLDDMEPLAGLAMLQYLRLDGNGIADITPLGSLTGMLRLVMRDNPVPCQQVIDLEDALPDAQIFVDCLE